MTKAPVGLTYHLQSLAIGSVAEGLADEGLDDLADVVRGQRRIEMLGRDDDLGRFGRLAVLVAHGDLRLGIGAEDAGLAVAAGGGEKLDDAVGVVDRRRHQVGVSRQA